MDGVKLSFLEAITQGVFLKKLFCHLKTFH